MSETVTSTYNLYSAEDTSGEYIVVEDKEGGAYLPLPIVPASSSNYSEKVEVTGEASDEVGGACVIIADTIDIIEP